MEVTAGLAESNGSLLPGLWRDSLHVTCRLTACTPGSAPGPTLGNEYGKTLPFSTLKQIHTPLYKTQLFCRVWCSVRFFCRPRSEGWPHHGRTVSILSLSSVILIDSSTESPVHVLMVSFQAVRGLNRLAAMRVAWIAGSLKSGALYYEVRCRSDLCSWI